MVQLLKSLAKGEELSREMAQDFCQLVSTGNCKAESIGAFLGLMAVRPVNKNTLINLGFSLREHSIQVNELSSPYPNLMDVCGTGGDGHGSFNISTCVAFVVAAAGIPIAKHGNRSVSSQCGSFDVLESLGVSFCETPSSVTASLKTYGLSFMYAPSFQPKLAELSRLRRSVGLRTVMNAMGPLLNPARVKHQLIGVYSQDLLLPFAETLAELGTRDAMIVCGDDGSDEISLCSETKIAHLSEGKHIELTHISPEQFGFSRAQHSDLMGGTPIQNAKIVLRILQGELGPRRDVVVLNAAVALYIAKKAENIEAGIALAKQSIDSKAAAHLLYQMSSVTAKES